VNLFRARVEGRTPHSPSRGAHCCTQHDGNGRGPQSYRKPVGFVREGGGAGRRRRGDVQ
jgi:hypothetical protein